MKMAITYVDVCAECPFYDEEDKYCTHCDLDLSDIEPAATVHSECTLEDTN